MTEFIRCCACALAVLIVFTVCSPKTRAGEFDLWDLTGTDLLPNTSSRGGDDLWDLLGTDERPSTSSRGVEDDIRDLMGSGVAGSPGTVEFKDVGIVLSVTPTVSDSKERAEPLFVLFPDETWFNVGTDRNPRWEPISKDEFQLLFEELEKQDFGLTAEVYEEGRLILQFVLM